MSSFELEPVDGGASIPLPEGETQIGRGPFLGVSDKRVSRHHGLLAIVDGQLRIKPTHQNPCFYQPSLGDPPEPLEKDRWHPLRPGNLFSLLPGKYTYRVASVNTEDTQRNSLTFEEEQPVAGAPPASAKHDEEPLCSPELNGEGEPTQNSTQDQQAEPTSSSSRQKEEGNKKEATVTKEQEPESRELGPKPEQRKRVLPAWMMQIASDVSSPSTSTGDRRRGKGKATPTQAKQTRPRKGRNRSVSSEEEEESERRGAEPAPKKRAKRLKSEEEEEVDAQSKQASSAEAVTRRPRGLSNDASGEASDYAGRGSDTEKGEGSRNGGRAPKAGPPEGKRGADVTGRREKESLSQDGETPGGGQEVGSAEGAGSTGRAGPSQAKAKAPPRPPCPYGKDCYRKNPVHFKESSHPGDSDYQEEEDEEEKEEDDDRPECPYGTSCYRKNPQHKKEYKHTQDPGKKARLDDEDDGEEDEGDDDSFINDDSGDLDEDSDYVPPESEDEDVQRLKKEAKAFLKRKR
ncbi:aprataxin and PNK-like factor isoform X1 [Anguilla rostrata]|uniref:aprataxin and PNK-like factor isoform X1 n=1 Tax=Anguilla rostrata TaxID=7938 RepID=UPI0030D28085